MKKKEKIKCVLMDFKQGDYSLNEAIEEINNIFKRPKDEKPIIDCSKCEHYFVNPFDQYFCHKHWNIDTGIDCGGMQFEKRK